MDPATTSPPSAAQRLRLVAFYLPQFHPTAQNDAWWGKGFTEWTNVTKAQPLFSGHYQPHLPADLGFYDLRLRQVRHEQIALAKQYGISAFCYHYYWFSGQRLLHEPLDDMLADPASDMPFCLCWANETWTRRWDGAEHQVLMEQQYAPGDALRFIQDLEPYLRDPRYIRVDGRPLLIVYRPQHMTHAREWAQIWRDHCRAAGLGELHICAALTHGNEDYAQYGFDSGVEFPPHNMRCESVAQQVQFAEPFYGYLVQYADVAQSFLQRQYPQGAKVFKGVFPSWDNTARTGARAAVFINGTPTNYGQWLAGTLQRVHTENPTGDNLVFINAWNEWAEGCHLEPDRRYGRAFLEATQAALQSQVEPMGSFDTGLPKGAQTVRGFWADLAHLLHVHLGRQLGQLRTRINRHPKLRAAALALVRAWRRLQPQGRD